MSFKLNRKVLIQIMLHILTIIDILLISFAMIYTLPIDVVFNIQLFDFITCILLLTEWACNFHKKPKKEFLKNKNTWIDLIASIPFDVLIPFVLPQIGILRYLRLLKLLRLVALSNRFYHRFQKFIKISNLDKILISIIFTIILFTLLLFIFGSSNNIFDDFYFVIITLTTVGYGDIVPDTFNEKIIVLILVIVGVFVFSTITASISSYLTDKIIKDDDKEIQKRLDDVMGELKDIRKENERLTREVEKLNEYLKK